MWNVSISNLNILYFSTYKKCILHSILLTKNVLKQPSLAYPSAQPHVSTLTSCNSKDLTGTEQHSNITCPVKGSSKLHLVESKQPFSKKSGAPAPPLESEAGVILKGTGLLDSWGFGLYWTRNCWVFCRSLDKNERLTSQRRE